MPFRASLKNLIRRTPAAPSLRERAASLRASISLSGYGPRPLPAPGSQEAKAAFAAACREHSIRTNPADGWPSLERDGGQIWTRDVLGKAMDAGEITPAEYARLYPLASERELLIETAGHDLNLGSLFALAYADEYPLRLPAAETETAFADQVALAGAEGTVLAGSGVDHRDGTVSYADATGKVSRRPMAQWVGFNALQMHHRVGTEIARRRTIEANHLPADEHAGWEAKIRRDLRSDAVFALSFHPERAFKAAQDLRSGAEPMSAEARAAGDADLIALAPQWQAASDAYDQAIQEQIAVSRAADDLEPPPSQDRPHAEWLRLVEGWHERTGVKRVEAASAEALDDLSEIEDRIAGLPAASLAGLRLKARVAQRCDDISVNWPDGLGDGLVRDLLAFGADGLASEDPDGDALLLQLSRQFEAAREREIVACEACNAAGREAERHMPERPACLTLRASDAPLHVYPRIMMAAALEGIQLKSADIEWLRGRMPMVHEVLRPIREGERAHIDHPGRKFDIVPHPEAQARAEEIVGAWDTWWAEKIRVHGEYLTDALDEAANDAGSTVAALAEQIAALPARTAEGFRVKLRALAHCSRGVLPSEIPADPDPDQSLAHSLWRDAKGEAAPAAELDQPRADDPVFAAIDASRRAEAAMEACGREIKGQAAPEARAREDECADVQVAAMRAALGTVPTTRAGRLALVDFTEFQARLCYGENWRATQRQDVFGEIAQALSAAIRAERVEKAPVPSALADQIDFASATLDDLRCLRVVAEHIGNATNAQIWGQRCWTPGGKVGSKLNALGKLMMWISDALSAVESAAESEAKRREPEDPDDRETRLSMLAVSAIDNGDPEETAAFARELLAHAEAERAGR